VLSVYERILPASLAVGGGLATASVSDVLRRRRAESLGRTVSGLRPAARSRAPCWTATPVSC
jgi:hypothetical protein